MRRAPAYLAESIRVLAAEYSSTLRKVQSKTPHAARPPPATKGPEKGTPSRRMQAPPAPHFVLILSSNHCERHARHQTTTAGRQTAIGSKRFRRQERKQRGVTIRTPPISRPASPAPASMPAATNPEQRPAAESLKKQRFHRHFSGLPQPRGPRNNGKNALCYRFARPNRPFSLSLPCF